MPPEENQSQSAVAPNGKGVIPIFFEKVHIRPSASADAIFFSEGDGEMNLDGFVAVNGK